MRRMHRWDAARALALAAASVLVMRTGLDAQEPPPLRMWAAQTGPDQLTLAWAEVPGAVEYRLHLGDPAAAASPAARRPISVLSGSARGGSLLLRRVTARLFLVAVGSDGRTLATVPFNEVTPVRGLRRVDAPASATATATGPEEVTLTWDPVPGATGYAIGRAVQPNGFQMLCALCSTEPTYVDRDVTPGAAHAYTVAAIYSGGISARTRSNTVTPGDVAAAGPGESSDRPARTPLPSLPPRPQAPASGYTPPGQPSGTTPPTTTPTTPTTPANPQVPATAPDTAPPRVNPQIPATVADTTTPPLRPTPSGATSLATPPADTGTCKVVTAPPPPTTRERRIDVRSEGIERRTTGSNPDATTGVSVSTVVTTTNLGSAEFQKGKCQNPYATGYPDLWDPVASASGMTSDERIAAWKEIGVVALEYRHILGRQPTPDETKTAVAALKAGKTWQQLWRQLAHSDERTQRFGFWAPAPIPDSVTAQQDFGTRVPPWTSQQCFGGLGPKCDGGIPAVINSHVEPYWFGAFRMPDNTELAYVEIGVAVGSILHDNACLYDKGGLNCNGVGAGDLVKIGRLWGAGLEWNKASWNVIDQRTWRQTFGPYPRNVWIRERDWYDDLRPEAARPTMMAPAISMFAWPGLTLKYLGGETRQSKALLAPAGTSLDDTDVAFCKSGVFASKGWFVGKASWGICQ